METVAARQERVLPGACTTFVDAIFPARTDTMTLHSPFRRHDGGRDRGARGGVRLPTARGLVVAVTAVTAFAAGPAAGQEGRTALAVLAEAEHTYEGVDTMCADFRQTIEVPLLQQSSEGAGRLCEARPNLFSMRFEEPEGDLIVVDGRHVWMYTPSHDEDQVIQLPLSASSDGRAIDFRREFLEEPGERYDVTLMRTVEAGRPPAPDDEATYLLSLVPRGSTEYEEARVWIGADSHLIRRVEIHEENGSVRTIAISGIDLHAAPSPDTFSFTPPPGTRVITP